MTTAQPETPFSELQPYPITVAELGDGLAAVDLMQPSGSYEAVGRRDRLMSLTLSRAEPDPGATGALPQPAPARRRPRPRALLVAGVLVALVLVAPLVVLLVEASGAGIGTVSHLIFRSLTATLLWNTVRLTVVVTLLCAVIGTAAAWCVECTDLPGRRIWAVLVVVPFAIPDFVVSFGWASLSTWIQGFRGAVVVMTLAVYPLVYLPVAASFRSADPGQEEVARSLGVGGVRTFFA